MFLFHTYDSCLLKYFLVCENVLCNKPDSETKRTSGADSEALKATESKKSVLNKESVERRLATGQQTEMRECVMTKLCVCVWAQKGWKRCDVRLEITPTAAPWHWPAALTFAASHSNIISSSDVHRHGVIVRDNTQRLCLSRGVCRCNSRALEQVGETRSPHLMQEEMM